MRTTPVSSPPRSTLPWRPWTSWVTRRTVPGWSSSPTRSRPAMAGSAGPEPRSAAGAYVDWHRAVAAEVTRQVGIRRGAALEARPGLLLAVRSAEPAVAGAGRQRPPARPAERRCPGVVLVPIGFISDHMEVIFDLDTEALATAAELGLPFVRAATAGVHPAFVAGLVDLMLERAAAARGEQPARPVVEEGLPGGTRASRTAVPNLREPGRPGPGPDRLADRRDETPCAKREFWPWHCVIRGAPTHGQHIRALHVI